jgi:glycerol kinase
MIYNINTMSWDKELLDLFNIPESLLPEVCSSSEVYAHTTTTLFAHKVPIAGIAGDQQAALFGQMCTEPGMVKNTYGTGCFMVMNVGDKPVMSKNKLLTTVAWKLNGKVTYAIEGSIFMGGAIVQWLRDGLKVIESSSDIEKLSASVKDNGGVYFVPALTGLGAPHWDQYARGTIVGITRGTTAGHIGRAALEGIAFQVKDVLDAMKNDAAVELKELRVDGGAAINNPLMQFQSDIIGSSVVRPKVLETTAMGAAYLAGLAVGFWDSVDEIKKHWEQDIVMTPKMEKEKVDELLEGWDKALGRSKNWINN